MTSVNIKRAYEPYQRSDGYRILIDRYWPRGLSRERAHINLWFKEIGPSAHIIGDYHSGRDDYAKFKQKYRDELAESRIVRQIMPIIRSHRVVTLIYSSRNPKNNAHVLLSIIRRNISK